jgi:hypothetical protein
MNSAPMIFAQAGDLGLWFWLLVAVFSVTGVLLAGTILFLVTRSLYRFGVQRVPFGWIAGFAVLVGVSVWYVRGSWGLLAGAYVVAAYLPGRIRGARMAEGDNCSGSGGLSNGQSGPGGAM